jgi:hypothetical protein
LVNQRTKETTMNDDPPKELWDKGITYMLQGFT